MKQTGILCIKYVVEIHVIKTEYVCRGRRDGKWEHVPYSMHCRRVGNRLFLQKVENDLQRASTE